MNQTSATDGCLPQSHTHKTRSGSFKFAGGFLHELMEVHEGVDQEPSARLQHVFEDDCVRAYVGAS